MTLFCTAVESAGCRVHKLHHTEVGGGGGGPRHLNIHCCGGG